METVSQHDENKNKPKKITDLEEIIRIMDLCKKKIRITIDKGSHESTRKVSRLYQVLSASSRNQISPFWEIKSYRGEISEVFADEIDSIELV